MSRFASIPGGSVNSSAEITDCHVASLLAMTQKYDTHSADLVRQTSDTSVIPRNLRDEESVPLAAQPPKLPPRGKLSKITDF